MRLAFLLILAACKHTAPFEPTTVPTTAQPNAVLSAATRVLIERGDSIDSRDDTGGVLTTKWRESTRLNTHYKYRWTVTLANGEITVDSQCQVLLKDSADIIADSASWKDCEEQPEGMDRKARAIAKDIVRAAGNAPAPTAPPPDAPPQAPPTEPAPATSGD